MHIFFTVTNDLSYDQRMQRICTTLATNGYKVTLLGRRQQNSIPLEEKPYRQQRLRCWFNKGKMFYAEYNLRLLIFLIFRRMDAICAIDLDTILPCLFISRIKKIPRVYDAHELFTEMKEVITRPRIRKTWTGIEKRAVPKFSSGYTVSEGLAKEFRKRYGVQYATIRNLPVMQSLTDQSRREPFLLYQGAVNEARGFEILIPAMKMIHCKLVICGDGNFMAQLKELIRKHAVEDKVEMKGMLSPTQLREFAQTAWIGISVPEKEGLNQYLALPNKFFDYIHAGLPQVTANYPEYHKINEQYEVAILVSDADPEKIARAVNHLLENTVLYERLRSNCLLARKVLNWQQEEVKLLAFYKSIFDR